MDLVERCPMCGELSQHTTAARQILGTTHWCGTVDGLPAVLVSFYGGAVLWGFDGHWKQLIRGDGISVVQELMSRRTCVPREDVR